MGRDGTGRPLEVLLRLSWKVVIEKNYKVRHNSGEV